MRPELATVELYNQGYYDTFGSFFLLHLGDS